MAESLEEMKHQKLTEKDFDLISQANCEFNNKLYVQCLQSLNQLELSMGADSKITHNKAVIEVYKTDGKEYKTFLKFLENDIKNETMPHDRERRNMSTVFYNIAVVLYHLKKPIEALKNLSPIIEKSEDFDDDTRCKAELLMLALLLKTNQYKKAKHFVEFLQERNGFINEIFVNDENTCDLSQNNENVKRMYKILVILTNLVNENNFAIPDDGSIEFTMLKARQYYIGKDFQMAAKQFQKVVKLPGEPFKIKVNGENQSTAVANNMGVIHLRVRHYAVAVNFFQRAIIFDKEATTDIKNCPLYHIGASKKPEILYNMGIAMLHLQRPKEAFECFLICSKIYHKNPRLWLRIAEACIMVYEKDKKDTEKKHIVTSVIGTGLNRKYVLEPTKKVFNNEDHLSAFPYPNLEFALLCLRNSVSLLHHYNKELDDLNSSGEQRNWNDVKDAKYCNPSPTITKESCERLTIAVYTAYSFVCLRLADYKTALEYAELLLKQPNLSDAYAMLGHLYCAESLIMFNRLPEARAYLEPQFITNLNSHDFETKDWQITSIEAAQSVLRYNLVVTLALQGEYDLAKTLLATCTNPVVFTKFKMLKMYLELVADKIENCKIMVRLDTPHFR